MDIQRIAEALAYCMAMVRLMIAVAPLQVVATIGAVVSFVFLWRYYTPLPGRKRPDPAYTRWLETRVIDLETCLRLYANPAYEDGGQAARSIIE